ncbi:MAG: tRNA (adenosine(37)-N6)-threonylcarbamoyltransferase complex ATPase subunit type 1 TsaE [Eubacterium sp.]|nr:tRNA (adenosine(37)-N6)-threonylcarbamoyltransferase complex ATPase subunit type 1 TsaE [Eubacterium sp.]
MQKKYFETQNEKETLEFGKRLSEVLPAGSVVCLDGDLGVGKTVIARGIAMGLGIDEPVTSPTFTIIHEYESGRMPFYHFDVYRIADPDEMDELGYEEYFYSQGITLVEWGSLIEELFPEDTVYIRVEKVPGEDFDRRRIEVSAQKDIDI